MATKPNLALLPSGYKASKVYSVLPSDGVGDFDFSRSSNATRVNKDGLIELVDSNVPRLNYPLIDGVVSGCPSLLLEPSRTNLITYSEDFSDISWIRVGTSVSSNNSISPDGTLNGDLIQATSNVGLIVITNFLTETQQIISVFAKSGNYDKFKMGQASNEYYAEFDLTNGSVLNVNANLSEASIDYYGNGWYRCSVAYASPLGLKTLGIVIEGNGNSVNFFGAQSEFGSYATSYIPTQGSIGTRVAESCEQTPPSGIIGQTEGVAYVEIDWKGNDEESIFSVLHDGTINNRMDFGYSAVFNSFYFNVRTGGSGQGLMQYASPTIGKYKIAISYKNNNFALWVNGVKEAVDNSGSVPVTTQYNVGNYIGGGREHSIINSKLYNKELTDAELQALTQV